jgi:hypothetical protein
MSDKHAVGSEQVGTKEDQGQKVAEVGTQKGQEAGQKTPPATHPSHKQGNQ